MYGHFLRFNQLVFIRLVCICLSVFFVPKVLASPFDNVQGVRVISTSTPVASVGASNSYVFDSTNPRYTFISANARNYPVPTSTVATTYNQATWSPLARRALARSGVGIAVIFGTVTACRYFDCSGLWGEPLDLNSIGSSPDYNWGDGSLYSVLETVSLTSNDPLSDGWNELGSTIHNLIETRLAQTTVGTGSNERPIATFLVSQVGQVSTHYQVSFRVRYAYTDVSFNCPTGGTKLGNRCVPATSVPFDESLFADAVPQATTNTQFNNSLWELIEQEAQASTVILNIDEVEQSTNQTVTTNGVTQEIETVDTFTFPVTNNGTSSPTVNPTKTTTTNTYEAGNLVDTTTVVETGSSTGGLPGSGSSSDIPTDCDFFPTLCEWLDWFRDDVPPEEPDFDELLLDDVGEVEFTFNGGSGSCPAPLDISLTVFSKTVQLKYDVICDYAVVVSYFVLISASLFSALIVIRSVR